MVLKLVAVFCLVYGLVAAEKVSFDNYRVYSVNVKNEQQLLELVQLENAGIGGIQFWQSPSGIGRKADIMVAPNQVNVVSELIEKLNLESHVMVENVQT